MAQKLLRSGWGGFFICCSWHPTSHFFAKSRRYFQNVKFPVFIAWTTRVWIETFFLATKKPIWNVARDDNSWSRFFTIVCDPLSWGIMVNNLGSEFSCPMSANDLFRIRFLSLDSDCFVGGRRILDDDDDDVRILGLPTGSLQGNI